MPKIDMILEKGGKMTEKETGKTVRLIQLDAKAFNLDIPGCHSLGVHGDDLVFQA